MNLPIMGEAVPNTQDLINEAVANASGVNTGTYAIDRPVEVNLTLPSERNNTPAPYEARDIDIPAVPQAEQVHQPKPGTPRWNEMYHKAKKADRQEQEIAQLKQTVETLAKNMGNVTVSNINSEISNAQKLHKEALENGDYAKASQLNTDMMTLVNKKQALESTFGAAMYSQPQVQQQPPIAEAINNQYQQPSPPIEAIVAVQTFEQNNPWYVTDPGLNAAFNAYHKQTMQDPNWEERPISSQLNESLRRFRGAFPEKFRQVAPPSAVAGVTPSAPAYQPQAVTLSQEERQIALMFAPIGTPPEVAEAEFLKNKTYYVQQGVNF